MATAKLNKEEKERCQQVWNAILESANNNKKNKQQLAEKLYLIFGENQNSYNNFITEYSVMNNNKTSKSFEAALLTITHNARRGSTPEQRQKKYVD